MSACSASQRAWTAASSASDMRSNRAPRTSSSSLVNINDGLVQAGDGEEGRPGGLADRSRGDRGETETQAGNDRGVRLPPLASGIGLTAWVGAESTSSAIGAKSDAARGGRGLRVGDLTGDDEPELLATAPGPALLDGTFRRLLGSGRIDPDDSVAESRVVAER